MLKKVIFPAPGKFLKQLHMPYNTGNTTDTQELNKEKERKKNPKRVAFSDSYHFLGLFQGKKITKKPKREIWHKEQNITRSADG